MMVRAKLATPPGFRWNYGDGVNKKSGSEWFGPVVGFYSTDLTPEGYHIESAIHKGSVQCYPVAALQRNGDYDRLD